MEIAFCLISQEPSNITYFFPFPFLTFCFIHLHICQKPAMRNEESLPGRLDDHLWKNRPFQRLMLQREKCIL